MNTPGGGEHTYYNEVRRFNHLNKDEFLVGWTKIDVSNKGFQVPDDFNMKAGDILSSVEFYDDGGKIKEVYLRKGRYVKPARWPTDYARIYYFRCVGEGAGYIHCRPN